MRKAVHAQRGHSESAIDKVQRAAVQGAQAGHEGSVPASSQKGVTRLSIERAHFDIKDYLWSGTIGVIAYVGGYVMPRAAPHTVPITELAPEERATATRMRSMRVTWPQWTA